MSSSYHSPYYIPPMASLEEARAVALDDTLTTLEGESQRPRIVSIPRSSANEDQRLNTLPHHLNSKVLGNQDEKCRTDSVANQHHLAGFSAEAFADYESRIKSSLAARQLPLGSLLSQSTLDDEMSKSSFDSSGDMEKGLVSPIAKPSAVHGRESSSTISSDSSEITRYNLNIPETRNPAIRQIRHSSFGVYRRLFSIVFIANIVALVIVLARISNTRELSLSNLATAASANFLVAILIRQDYIVNVLFRTCWLVPHSIPLRIRRILAKVYENGGVHSGAAVAGTVWYILLTAVLTRHFIQKILMSVSVVTLTYILLVVLCCIIIFAYPRFRFMSHVRTSRFAGWSAIGIFWAELALLTSHSSDMLGQSFEYCLIRAPTFWFLIIITFHLVLPWLRLRKWHFQPEQLSNHAVRLNFDTTLSPLSGLAISESPLREWHPFATFPKAGGGGSMIISSAGDWTKRTVLAPKTRYWVKGVPKTGVLSMAFIFKRVVVVTTGSGIGPCLSFLREPTRKTVCRVLWSTPAPLKTYGYDICNSVREVDRNALIIDTRESGRPDMISLTYNLFIESKAEAVFCISNPAMTRKIVFAMESRGIPAFGPIWDS